VPEGFSSSRVRWHTTKQGRIFLFLCPTKISRWHHINRCLHFLLIFVLQIQKLRPCRAIRFGIHFPIETRKWEKFHLSFTEEKQKLIWECCIGIYCIQKSFIWNRLRIPNTMFQRQPSFTVSSHIPENCKLQSFILKQYLHRPKHVC